MVQSWSSWKRFPDVESGDNVEAPIGPGVYEVRQVVASINISGATGHVQSRSGDTFSIHFDAPPHLLCKTRSVRVPSTTPRVSSSIRWNL